MSWVWQYYEKISADYAKCLRCNKKMRRSGGSTKGMITHLSTHNIQKPSVDSVDEPPTKKIKIQQQVSSFVRRESLEEILSKCVAKDGFSVDSLHKSEAIIGFVKSRGFEMPKSRATVTSYIINFHQEKFEQQNEEIQANLKSGIRLVMSFDEWQDLNAKRYVNIGFHVAEKSFQSKLLPILCTDTQIRWNTMLPMITRYLLIKDEIGIQLWKFSNAKKKFSNIHDETLQEMLNVLNSIKKAVVKLSSQNANLITAEGAYKYVFTKLKDLNLPLSKLMLDSLHRRVNERRKKELVSLMLFSINAE
jgi:hypothetical protein